MNLPVLLAAFFLAQMPLELSPGARYDARIPTLKQVVGHDYGDEITTPEAMAVYLRALQQAAPDRARLIEYARSWEGRPLHLMIIGNARRIARLDQVKADLRRLADPRGLTDAEADRLLRELPVVTWLMHAVHGNEISSCEAALAEAYHLLAAQGDAAVEAILRESIVVIDPLQNPDGRTRFITQSLMGRSAAPDAEPLSAEHDEPWPGGRSNHYLFDMNRDWFAQSQVETRGRIQAMLEWFPHVVVDLHEMSGDSTYYFAPPADPLNPHITVEQIASLEMFGKANAARFDERGFTYFIREVFDSFYPGYGESWPIFHGAVGMTYEQGSTRGLVWRRPDETLLTYRQAVVHQFTAALTTAATAARNRDKLLRDFFQYRRRTVEEGAKGPVREYALVPGEDPSRALLLARNLASQGIEVRRTAEPARLGERTLPAGAFLISNAQPAGRLVRNLLDADTPQPEKFVEEQNRRRKLRLPDQIYDITGWSLPHVFDVEVLKLDQPAGVKTKAFSHAEAPAQAKALPPAKVAYLMPWGSAAAAATADALQAGLRIHHATRPFTLGGRRYAFGAAIFRVSENGADLAAKLGAIAARHDAEVVASDTGWVDDGISLGSNDVQALKPVRLLLAWDAPTQSQSAGWARYTLERRFGQPASAVRVGSLAGANLSRFDVIVLPAGNYSSAIGEDLLRRLRDWMRAGGTLVTIGEASRWAANEKVNLLETRTELRGGRPEVASTDKPAAETKPGQAQVPFDYDKAIQPDRDRPENNPGAVMRITLESEHWLAAGHDGEIQVIVEGQRVFTPITFDKGRNVGVYAERSRLIAGGLAWPEAQDQLARKAYLIHQPVGRGHLVAFAEDPNYRAFTEAAALLFINAVLLGPAY